MQTQLRTIQEKVVELVIILILTLITFPVVTLSEGVPRIILGVIFLLIFPGYTLMAALFPGKKSMTYIERAGLTFVLSFALVALIGLVLNYTPWGVRLTPVTLSMTIIILILSGIAFVRRRNLSESKRFIPQINIRMPGWRNTSRFEKVLSIGMVVVLLGAIYMLVYLVTQPMTGQAFTEFYIVSPKAILENNPYELILKDQLEITLAIENHENTNTSYNLVVTFDGKETQTIGPKVLTDEEKWSDQITLSPSKVGDNQKVEFLLYKGEESVPYLTLRLWLDVRE
jgi:uncharacterized membrane protein